MSFIVSIELNPITPFEVPYIHSNTLYLFVSSNLLLYVIDMYKK